MFWGWFHFLIFYLPFLAFHIIYFLLLVKISIWISLAILAQAQSIIGLKKKKNCQLSALQTCFQNKLLHLRNILTV